MVNEVENVYNDFWQLQQQYQEHSGAVNTSTSPSVQYAYEDGSANTVRPREITYPHGNTVGLGYGTTGGADDLLSRIDSIAKDGDTVAGYNFLGLGTPVIVQYPDPAVQYNLATGSAPGLYAGLDTFGRVIDCRWQTTGGSPVDLVRLKYGYDRASNRQWRQDSVAESLSKNFDEFYLYDGVYRLAGLARGLLTGGPPFTGVTGQTFGESWSLDTTGNWGGYTQESTAGTDTLAQTRTANAVNEITGITNTVGSAWSQPGYDAAGNTTTMPQPNSPGNPYSAIFDAWQRLRFLNDTSGPAPVLVQENQYDGRNFRTVRNTYASGTLSDSRDFYYNSWHAVEERVSGAVDRQYVWGLRYIDDLVLRDRFTGSETLNERLYAMQDGNWNMAGICDGDGTVKERYAYAAYGVCQFLNPEYSSLSLSAYDWSMLYTGRELDPQSGLYNYRARTYDPSQGRFMQLDPVALSGGANLYEYVGGQPTDRLDPNGTVPIYCSCYTRRYNWNYTWVQIECSGKPETCCASACIGYRGWSGSWYGLPELRPQPPQSNASAPSAACIPAVIATGAGAETVTGVGTAASEAGATTLAGGGATTVVATGTEGVVVVASGSTVTGAGAAVAGGGVVITGGVVAAGGAVFVAGVGVGYAGGEYVLRPLAYDPLANRLCRPLPKPVDIDVDVTEECEKKADCYCMCLKYNPNTPSETEGPYPIGRMTRSACKSLPYKKREYSYCYCKGDP